MLPFVARGAAHEIDRAAIEAHRGALPAAAAPAAHLEGAGRDERDADHVAEVRPVAMSADRRARPVFGDQNVLQAFGREAGEHGGALADEKKKRRHRLGFLHAAAVEIVAEAERHDAALAEEAVKLELLERQVGQGGNEVRFLVSIDHVRRVAEAGRHRLRLKECELLVFHGKAG